MKISERKWCILQSIINDFIQSAEPVGSRTLSKKYNLGISAATIRNEMSDLEEMGYLKQPYTSAGRVPCDKAYRLYVDNLSNVYKIPNNQKVIINERLINNYLEFEKTIERASKLLSEMTNLTCFALSPQFNKNSLEQIKLIPIDANKVLLMILSQSGVNNTVLRVNCDFTNNALEQISKLLTNKYHGNNLSDLLKHNIINDLQKELYSFNNILKIIMPNILNTLEDMLNVELYLEGITKIFNLPEYNDIGKAKEFIEMLSQKDYITNILVNRNDGIDITIGKENEDNDMQDCSIITATYRINGQTVGKLGVIGPTRMDYDKVISVVDYMTNNLTNIFKINNVNK